MYFILRTDIKMHLQLFRPHFDGSGWHLPNVVIFQVPEKKKSLRNLILWADSCLL